MKVLRTARLRLIPVTPHNAAQLWKVLQEPDLRAFQDLPNVGLAAFREMVAKRPAHLEPGAAGRFEWLVYLTGSSHPAGWVSLRISESGRESGEIGYSVLRERRRRGIATEAVTALLKEAFEHARLRAVQAFCVPANLSSRRLLERLGFREDGVLPHGATVAGEAVDVIVHRLECSRWSQSGKTMLTPASA